MSADNREAALASFVGRAVEEARAVDAPFFHLELDRIFPDDVYAAMLAEMPGGDRYRAMAGRARHFRADGRSTRVILDLLPEYTRRMPEVWRRVGAALRSRGVQSAFVRRLAPALRQRFGERFDRVGFYPLPILTRDIPGYSIAPHTDTKWKGITVQLFLPRDDRHAEVGTVFHRAGPGRALEWGRRMPFVPNHGYAFAVGDDTWHSVEPVGDDVETRDSILLTYMVDSGFRRLRNRWKRVGQFVEQSARRLTG